MFRLLGQVREAPSGGTNDNSGKYTCYKLNMSSSDEPAEKNKPAEENEAIPAKVHSANSWENADLGDDERKKKFLKLMGASKPENGDSFAKKGDFVFGNEHIIEIVTKASLCVKNITGHMPQVNVAAQCSSQFGKSSVQVSFQQGPKGLDPGILGVKVTRRKHSMLIMAEP